MKNKQKYSVISFIRNVDTGKHPLYKVKGFLHYTFVLDGAEIVTVGTNRFKIARDGNDFRHGSLSIHSELDALRKLKERGLYKNKDKFTFVNVRLSRTTKCQSTAAPCSKCQTMLDKHNIKVYEFVKV